MVAIEKSSKRRERGDGFTAFCTNKRSIFMGASLLIVVPFFWEAKAQLDDIRRARSVTTTAAAVVDDPVDVKSVSSLRSSNLRHEMMAQQQSSSRIQSTITTDNNSDQQCRWYLAESAIPQSGLGLFAGTGILPDEMVGFPDICIFVSDAPKHWTHLRSHTFGGGSFFGQYEGSNSRAACEGFSTTFNTQPQRLVNTELVSPILPTNGGLHRATSPGAGSITHHYGIHAKALDIITAGSELTIDYGDWDFDEKEAAAMTKPERPVSWLQEHGWCIDHLRVGPSTIPHAGRGAFARHALKAGSVVVPIPLQSFRNRKLFQNTQPEQLYTNYCLQPADSKMIFYPYGPVFNLVNHPDVTAPRSSPRAKPNVHLQWSSNHLHHASWLDLSYDEFWNVASPGGLILELVASREIAPGEEILLDYGQDWEKAWKAHTAAWKPHADAKDFVYPAEMDETETLRTVYEQKTQPYPDNLMTMCSTSDWDREKANHMTWQDPATAADNGGDYYAWWENMTYCHILDRTMGPNGNYEYTVSLIFSTDPKAMGFDESVDMKDLYIDTAVPRRAIRFLEKPYADDEHLPNAFRHPIEFPAHLVPDAWRNA